MIIESRREGKGDLRSQWWRRKDCTVVDWTSTLQAPSLSCRRGLWEPLSRWRPRTCNDFIQTKPAVIRSALKPGKWQRRIYFLYKVKKCSRQGNHVGSLTQFRRLSVSLYQFDLILRRKMNSFPTHPPAENFASDSLSDRCGAVSESDNQIWLRTAESDPLIDTHWATASHLILLFVEAHLDPITRLSLDSGRRAARISFLLRWVFSCSLLAALGGSWHKEFGKSY